MTSSYCSSFYSPPQKNLLEIFFIILLLAIVPLNSFAQTSLNDEEKTEKIEGIKDKSKNMYKIDKSKTAPRDKNNKWNCTLSFNQGYDNNVNLDSSRKGDLYTEEELNITYNHNFSKYNNLEFKYGLYHILYHEVTGNNRIDNEIGFRLKNKINRNVTLYTYYEVTDSHYPNDNIDDYLTSKLTLALKQRITDSFFHNLKYIYRYKWYDDKKRRDTSGNDLIDRREDSRYTFQWDWGAIIGKDLLNLSHQYSINGSNDNYYDYYDYYAYKISASWFHKFTEKINMLLNVGHQRKNYTKRLVSSISESQYDDTLTATGIIFYELTPDVSLSSLFIYRENNSNSTSYEYADRITSIGISYKF